MWRILSVGWIVLTVTGCACLTDFSYRKDATGRIHLGQCWDNEDQEQFYTTSQGSQIAPYKIATYVELAKSEERLLSPKNVEKWGYLVGVDSEGRPLSEANADGWPLGFVKDTAESGEWIGMTCAACHTAEIHFKENKIRIDGGPAMADFTAFINELDASLEATWRDGLKEDGRDGKKFDRYARQFPELGKDVLLKQLGEIVKDRKAWHDRNDPTLNNRTVSHGHARLDAFGVIFNEVSQALDSPQNIRKPDAPVSYPFLWDTHYHVWNQWNGVAAAIPMGRNIGQVLGVFGKVKVKDESGKLRISEPSIRMENLRALQNKVKKLRSPVWPEDILGKLDRGAKAAKGKALFDKHCLSCHASQARTRPVTILPLSKIDIPMGELFPSEPGKAIATDPKMAENAAREWKAAGDSSGDSKRLKDQTANVATGIIFTDFWEAVRVAFDFVVAWVKGESTQTKLQAYKARPLDGIWATAPYLHNGSVANLYELLLPPEKRLKTFRVGSRKFDPTRVGFVTEEGPYELDTRIEGNRNTGHSGLEYGSCLPEGPRCDEERWELVEYMKTL